jgi:hypothetical protein
MKTLWRKIVGWLCRPKCNHAGASLHCVSFSGVYVLSCPQCGKDWCEPR